MTHEAEQALLKTLNGQLSQLPSVAKAMIHQYQITNLTFTIIYIILSIILFTLAVLWYKHFMAKYQQTPSDDDFLSWDFTAYLGSGLLVIVGVIMFGSGLGDLYHSMNPVYSIVSDIISNNN